MSKAEYPDTHLRKRIYGLNATLTILSPARRDCRGTPLEGSKWPDRLIMIISGRNVRVREQLYPEKKGGSEVPPNSVAYLYSYYYGVCRQTGPPDSLSDKFGGITPPSPGT